MGADQNQSRDHLCQNRMEQYSIEVFNCLLSIGICLLLAVVYVASLYIWKSPYHRDHEYTIKRRFLSILFVVIISPAFLYMAMDKEILKMVTMSELLGLKCKGLIQAIFIPLILTMVLFLGPISMEFYNGISKTYKDSNYLITNITNLIWLRNHLVAPLSEEFTFRSCMLPILLQRFNPITSVFIGPLFFGVAHFHHMYEKVKVLKVDFSLALKISCFQFLYTTIFGIYSGYLFIRTGHFASTFIVHAFCNHMGFPDIYEVSTYDNNKRKIIIGLFILGFVLWCLLLKPLTDPHLYFNSEVWYYNS